MTLLIVLLVVTIASSIGGREMFRPLAIQETRREIEGFAVRESATDTYAGVRKTYEFAVPPTVAGGECISIYAVHQYAQVWMREEKVYESAEPAGWHLGKSPGCYWIRLPLEEGDRGTRVKIVFDPVYRNVTDRLPWVVIAPEGQTMYHVFLSQQTELTLSVVCVAAGLLCAVFSLLLRLEFRETMRLFYLGMFTLSCGVWQLFDLPLTILILCSDPMTGRSFLGPQTLYILSLLGLLLVPAFYTRFLVYQEEGNRLFLGLSWAAMFECVSLLTMQLLNLRDLRANLSVMQIFCLTGLVLVAGQTVGRFFRRDERGRVRLYEIFAILFAAGTIMDIFYYYRKGTSQGVMTLLLVVTLHIFLVGVLAVRSAVEQRTRAIQAEAQLADVRIRLLLSQIRPHFVYNTLTSIYYLCDEDPQRAKTVIGDFADYLQINFESLDKKETVALEEELRHTRAYLAIEQMRFGEDLQVIYDVAATESRLPALTIQPMVENAVKHGIGSTRQPETIRISTRRKEDGVEIIIQDDGQGFDPDQLEEEGVGMKNVRARLETMCGGTVDVESAPGEGTRVKIYLPSINEY